MDVQGEGLTYTWYYRLPKGTAFYRSTITDAEYTIKLTEDRVGREVYCIITDAFGEEVKTESVILK